MHSEDRLWLGFFGVAGIVSLYLIIYGASCQEDLQKQNAAYMTECVKHHTPAECRAPRW